MDSYILWSQRRCDTSCKVIFVFDVQYAGNKNSLITSKMEAKYLMALVWFGLFVHPFSHICNTGHVNYRLQLTTQLIIYGHPHNTI